MNYVLPEVQVNYREAHLKFQEKRLHNWRSLRRDLRRKVEKNDTLRPFEIGFRERRGEKMERKREEEV